MNDRNRAIFWFYLASLGFLVLGGLVTFSLEQALSKLFGESPEVWGLIFAALIFAGIAALPFLFGVRTLGKVLGSTAVMTNTETEQPKRFLITGYSPLKGDGTEHVKKWSKTFPVETAALPVEEFTAKCLSDSQTLPMCIWQQNVRAIYPHWKNNGPLELILVLNPDQDQFDTFKEFLQTQFNKEGRKDLEIKPITRSQSTEKFKRLSQNGNWAAPNYEDFEYVYGGLSRAVEILHKSFKERSSHIDAQICIDVTPGVKLFSIAAAIVTLNRRLKYSYVTNGGRIKFFDASVNIAGEM